MRSIKYLQSLINRLKLVKASDSKITSTLCLGHVLVLLGECKWCHKTKSGKSQLLLSYIL